MSIDKLENTEIHSINYDEIDFKIMNLACCVLKHEVSLINDKRLQHIFILIFEGNGKDPERISL